MFDELQRARLKLIVQHHLPAEDPSSRLLVEAFDWLRPLVVSMEKNAAVGIIGMGDMGRLYAKRFSQAGWRYEAAQFVFSER